MPAAQEKARMKHIEPRTDEQRQDDEAFATWQAEHEAALRWKGLAKRLWRQLRELRGKLRDDEARR